MGLFSFLKNAGSKIFDRKEEEKPVIENADNMEALEVENRQKEEILKEVVAGMQLPVENFNVDVNDETATIHGEVPTQAEREKVVLTVGNVHGISSVDDRLSVVTPTPEATMYTVESGDSLSKIAKAHYGDAMKYMIIFEANKPMLSDPDKIYPGQVLRIPPIN